MKYTIQQRGVSNSRYPKARIVVIEHPENVTINHRTILSQRFLDKTQSKIVFIRFVVPTSTGPKSYYQKALKEAVEFVASKNCTCDRPPCDAHL